MHFIGRIIVSFASNGLALFAADYLLVGLVISKEPKIFLTVTALLTFGNLIVRPILKFILSAFIFFTLGLFVIFINAFILYLVDIFSLGLTIQGFLALLLATLIISFTNGVAHILTKKRG